MNYCSISWNKLTENETFHLQGLKKISPRLKHLNNLNLSSEELRREAASRADKMSIQGVQPKLSAVIDIKNSSFKIVDYNGKYILKPPHLLYPEVAENESLTMSLAQSLGLKTPLHGLITNKDNTKTYFIKRFDRYGQSGKNHQEDFAQLAGKTRDTKYNYSMEKVVQLVDQYCTYPVVEKVKLFKRVIFCFLTGNEDMHLKNFSIVIENNIVKLSPVYDMLNTTILLENTKEEIALPINGKKNNLNFKDLIEYFGFKYCELNLKTIETFFNEIKKTSTRWNAQIDHSYLNLENRNKYKDLLLQRMACLQLI